MSTTIQKTNTILVGDGDPTTVTLGSSTDSTTGFNFRSPGFIGLINGGIEFYSFYTDGFYLRPATNANIRWITDGGGDIGQTSSARPNNIFAKANITAAGDLTSKTGNFIGQGTSNLICTDASGFQFAVAGTTNHSMLGTDFFMKSSTGTPSILWLTDGIGAIGNGTNQDPDIINAKTKHSTRGYYQSTQNGDPGAQTDSIAIGAKDSTAEVLRTLHIRTEQAVAADLSLVSTNSIKVWINNVEYKIALTAV